MKERKVFGISEATTTISDIERRGREAKKVTHPSVRTLCGLRPHSFEKGGGKTNVIRDDYKDANRINDSKNMTSSAQCS